MAMHSDTELIELTKNEDHAAFAELVSRYKGTVYNVVYSVTGNTQEADDIAQKSFLKVYFALRGFKGTSSFSTWLYRITVNQSLDSLKKTQARGHVLAGDRPSEDDRSQRWKTILSDDTD